MRRQIPPFSLYHAAWALSRKFVLAAGVFSVIVKTKEEKSVPTQSDEGKRHRFFCADCVVFLLRTIRFVKNCLYFMSFEGGTIHFFGFSEEHTANTEEYFYTVSCGRFAPGFAAKRTPRGGSGLTFPPFCGIMKKNFAKEREKYENLRATVHRLSDSSGQKRRGLPRLGPRLYSIRLCRIARIPRRHVR